MVLLLEFDEMPNISGIQCLLSSSEREALTDTHRERSINGLTNSDMSSNFFSLPRELRDRIYELVLLQQELIDPWMLQNLQQKLNPELLHVNKTIHREASSLIYAQNRFDFTMCTPGHVASFLGRIGRNNAGYIRHICLGFPKFIHLALDNVILEGR